ncbi:MAG: bifunctional riboflavin kinase/FAD synthetase [Pseudomonadota bacterium]
MIIIRDLKHIAAPFRNAVVTIGNFDGVHIGHQALFHEVVETADRLDGKSVAITFEPHPMRVLDPDGHPALITLFEQKSELIRTAGIDVLLAIPFTRQFSSIPAREFVTELLVKRIGMKAIIIGNDYAFGKNREGNIDRLKEWGAELNYEVRVVGWIQGPQNGGHRISSTKIRQLIMDGDMDRAQKLLGRHYQVRGDVAHGRDRGGRLLGFPTANITLQDELCPKTGVYAVTVELDGVTYQGVANIGFSPTFDDHLFTVEVHLFDFNRDIYGKKLRVNFIERLRDEIRFSGLEQLSEQIKLDVIRAREILSA